MKVEIISIGTELLMGDVVNTNANYLAKQLAELGFNHHYQIVLGDNPKRLFKQTQDSLKRSDILIFTGGLGPTYDDMTKEVVAKVFESELVFHEPSYQKIEDYFIKKGEPIPGNNKKQAMVPKDGLIFENEQGTAPGVAFEKEGKVAILLPGPPYEMQWMFKHHVRPYLEAKQDLKIVSRHVYLYGIGESNVEEKLYDLMKNSSNPTVAPYAENGSLMIRVTSSAKTEAEALNAIDPVVQKLEKEFADYVYGIDTPSLEAALVKTLQEKKLKIATAESCTGGLLAQKITAVSGSSQVFETGLITYANKTKETLLNVNADTLEKYGAVSPQVAQQMAQNVQKLANSDIGIGITGIAGPTGGTQEKPVGLVYVGICYQNKVHVEKLLLGRNRTNERDLIRQHAALTAMKLTLDFVNKVRKIA